MSSIEIDDTQMELLLKDVVETLDADGNGEVDLKEFVEGSLKVQSKTLSMRHQLQWKYYSKDSLNLLIIFNHIDIIYV